MSVVVLNVVVLQLLIFLQVHQTVIGSQEASSPQLNRLVKLFSSCYTDIIFVDEPYDVGPINSPVIISTPQANYSATWPTIANIQPDCLPHVYQSSTFHCENSTIPNFVRVRLNCISLIVLQVKSKVEIDLAVNNRHNWVHPTLFVTDVGAGNVNHYAHFYINVVYEAKYAGLTFDPVLEGNYQDAGIYYWTFGRREVSLQIQFILGCHWQSQPIEIPAEFDLESLDELYRSELKSHCHYSHWSLILLQQEGVKYFGSLKISAREYLKGQEWKKQTSELVLASMLISVFPNSSVIVPCMGSNYKKYPGYLDSVAKDGLTMTIFMFKTESDYTGGNQYTYPIENSGFGFINCIPEVRTFNYLAYWKPFDHRTWLTLCITVLICSAFWAIVIYFKRIRENPLFLFFSFLVEHSYWLPRKLAKLRSFNIFLGMFLLIGIVLTNGYKGLVITDLISPLSPYQISTFQEAVEQNYTIIGTPSQLFIWGFSRMFLGNEPPYNESDFEVEILGDDMNTLPSGFHMVIRNLVKHTTNSTSNGKLYGSVLKQLKPWFKRIRNIVTNGVASEFLKCNSTILAEPMYNLELAYNEILKLESDLPSKGQYIYMAQDDIAPTYRAMVIQDLEWNKGIIERRMSFMIQSGIWKRWKDLMRYKISESNERLRALVRHEPAELALHGNIATIFIASLIFLSISTVVFSFENRGSISKYLKLSWDRIIRTIRKITSFIETLHL